ncbi:hypothetical protein BDQ12DRAFT_721445 [Crucibulum laeve]|uniref:DUF221-domain-containing protein n=1 Tax=Crucibulum laeve TaxID=68775 RepID=A0A5C3M672_9AGAR|nr:hypothetical protein BDQ12DRAFT_721445 [Crucibulum laeve]
MTDIQTRPFSKNYSGLINQSVIAITITVLCVTGQELMKRRRRGKGKHAPQEGLGSRESWEFGYAFIACIKADHGLGKFPSPPTPKGWPLSWVKQVIQFPEARLNEIRGVDAALYIRFLRGAFWFTLLHTLTTFPILFPIHVEFSEATISPKSMTRASISSLVGTTKGLSLLWIHICLLFWLTLSWMATLLWICNGAFRLRAANLEIAARQAAETSENADKTYYPHPHPQYGFADIPAADKNHPNRGLRVRTVMVSNVPHSLRNEKDLKEYFEYYLSRKVDKPSMGLTSSTQPGFLNKTFAFVFNRAKRLPGHLPPLNPLLSRDSDRGGSQDSKENSNKSKKNLDVPVIERVVVARKMTELASLLERREDILRSLETAHIKLANKTLLAVKTAMDRKDASKPIVHSASKAAELMQKRRSKQADPEMGMIDEEVRMNQLIEVLGPYVEEFGCQRTFTSRSKKAISRTSKQAFRKLRTQGSEDSDNSDGTPGNPSIYLQERDSHPKKTVWEALLSLPRTSLDAYQPLINLSHVFRGKTVPAIDYYTAKLNLLTSLITENRAKAFSDYDPVSTAFVTFQDPADARRACKYLAVHPNNPLACLVTMAPMYQDLDWIRVMKSTFNAEFVRDWVVNVGVWAFTLFWLFPVSLLVGLVSIQNISLFWPSLKAYLDRHQWESEVIQSFLPTLLVALLALLIPLILLLIAKKAHTITTLSALHDRIMTRYYKFLIVNVLVFFCVGTVALQSFLESFRSKVVSRPDILKVVGDSFPTAGPFYVGWLIFTTAIHSCFELVMLGVRNRLSLPLIMYPSTSRQVTPRKRAVGIRPRTLNYYYWLPNHLMVIHVLLLFAVLNPFVLPFGTLYFFVQSGVMKNQLIHVYAKNYEGNGQLLLIRMVRYSLDGLVLSQAVFLAYMVVLKKSANVGLAAFLIVFTVLIKLLLTRMCRAQFEHDDIAEARILCGTRGEQATSDSETDAEGNTTHGNEQEHNAFIHRRRHSAFSTWRLPAWVNFSYTTMNHRRPNNAQRRPPNPFGPNSGSFSRIPSLTRKSGYGHKEAEVGPVQSATSPTDGYPWNNEGPASVPKIDLNVSNGYPAPDNNSPVVAHPPPIPWDDQGTPDLPYENPFYTRTIDNVLWLPQDPTNTLDLDDTIDLRVSLAVEVTAGQLGTWLGVQQTSSPDELSPVMSRTSTGPDQSSSLLAPPLQTSPVQHPTLLPDVDGTEEIDLPIVIAKRVQSKEDDIERTVRPRRPSGYRSKVSLGDKSSISTGSASAKRRPSFLEGPIPSFRSFSDNGPGRGRSNSIMSALHPPARSQRSRSTDHDSPRPDAHAQADFIVENASGAALPPPKLSRAQNVSAREAIAREVWEEEREALITRLEEEKAEEDKKARTTKSWLTSWMFRKAA